MHIFHCLTHSDSTLLSIFGGGTEVLGDLGLAIVFDLTGHQVNRSCLDLAPWWHLDPGNTATAGHPGKQRDDNSALSDFS